MADGRWDEVAINAACGRAYGRYIRARERHYEVYFQQRRELAGHHPKLARDLDAALPAGTPELREMIHARELHRWHLSAKSSQTLALGVFGTAMLRDPSLNWLAAALDVGLGDDATMTFEHRLSPDALGEQRRQTSIDVLVTSADSVLCIEAKWTERGLGLCRCGREERSVSGCLDEIVARTRYWDSAAASLNVKHSPGDRCKVGTAYQAVRNIAAAQALAGPGRRATFVLLYDERNPYFGGCEGWSGWPSQLDSRMTSGPVRFLGLSWQRLLGHLPEDEHLRRWLCDKHELA